MAKTSYSPKPMTPKQKETIRRAAEKKQALTNLKKDPIVKGVKAASNAAKNPIGTAAKVAGKVAGAYATGAKQMAKTIKDKVSPPKKQMGPTKSAFTPAQLAALKKMLSQGGNLDKPKKK
jgi:hypothetical protein